MTYEGTGGLDVQTSLRFVAPSDPVRRDCARHPTSGSVGANKSMSLSTAIVNLERATDPELKKSTIHRSTWTREGLNRKVRRRLVRARATADRSFFARQSPKNSRSTAHRTASLNKTQIVVAGSRTSFSQSFARESIIVADSNGGVSEQAEKRKRSSVQVLKLRYD